VSLGLGSAGMIASRVAEDPAWEHDEALRGRLEVHIPAGLIESIGECLREFPASASSASMVVQMPSWSGVVPCGWNLQMGQLERVAAAGVSFAQQPFGTQIPRGDAGPAHRLLDVAAADRLDAGAGAPVDQQMRVGGRWPAGTPRVQPRSRPGGWSICQRAEEAADDVALDGLAGRACRFHQAGRRP
jgi:hypothetical protein